MIYQSQLLSSVAILLSVSGCSVPADSEKLREIAASYLDIKAANVGELSDSNTLSVMAASCLRVPALMEEWLDENVATEDIGTANLQMMESTYRDLHDELVATTYLFDAAGYWDADAPRFAGEPNSGDPLVYRFADAVLALNWTVGRTPWENTQTIGINGEYPEFMPSADVDDEMKAFEAVCIDVIRIGSQ